MKKIFIATLTGVTLLVSVCEAQNAPAREEAGKKQFVEPPPPPPPPPPAPLPPPPPPPEAPTPPVPPIPANPNAPLDTEIAPLPPLPPPPPVPAESYITDLPAEQDRAKMMIPENEKGFVLSVRQENNTSMVVVRKRGVEIRKITLKQWLSDNKKYESIYGKLPPPPPPPAPPAPPTPRDRS